MLIDQPRTPEFKVVGWSLATVLWNLNGYSQFREQAIDYTKELLSSDTNPLRNQKMSLQSLRKPTVDLVIMQARKEQESKLTAFIDFMTLLGDIAP